MIGLGIDTGGTCTDAVICDLDHQKVLAFAKGPTTHHDLKEGIGQVLDRLPQDLLRRCGRIALSTTIATNACVENKGGRGKLILIGADRKVFERTHAAYGIRSREEVYLLACRLTASPEESEEPDWEQFRKDMKTFLSDCDCAAVVQMFAADHNAVLEKKAAGIIREQVSIPVIVSHDLFQERNVYRRGAGALLNARLIPEVQRFMDAVKETFRGIGKELPTVLIKSDGSRMSLRYAKERPVETLLSGPAASVIGAKVLADAKQAVIVDIGGTTTDVALIRQGIPDYSGEGIRIGGWKTFVKGLFIDTFGLGGDTAVTYTQAGKLILGSGRVIPLCFLASQFPHVTEKLKELCGRESGHPFPLHEFFCLEKDISGSDAYSEEEKSLCRILKETPLSVEEAAQAVGKDIYTFSTAHLEETGVIVRAGLTPTDIMHIRGEYAAYCREASLLAAVFVSRSCGIGSADELCAAVDDMVTERLYKNLVRILLATECPAIKDPDEQIMALIDHSWKLELEREKLQARRKKAGEKTAGGPGEETERTSAGKPGEETAGGLGEERKPGEIGDESIGMSDRMLPVLFQTPAKIVGVGAPSHLLLPRVARMLHTQLLIPPHAQVANAVGAALSSFSAVSVVTVTPVMRSEMYLLEVLTADERKIFSDEEDAYRFARQTGREEACRRAREQGAEGELTVTEEIFRREAPFESGTAWLGDTLRFRASTE